MKVYASIENDAGEVIARFNAPTVDMLIEKLGSWERAANNPIESGRVCEYCDLTNEHSHELNTGCNHCNSEHYKCTLHN